MEYGWQKVVPVYANGASDDHDRDHDHDDKASVRSGRSSMSKLGGTYGRRTLAPADRMHINDWRPPMPASMPSPLDEEAQLEALQVYIESLKKELDEHKAIEEPMIRQVSATRRRRRGSVRKVALGFGPADSYRSIPPIRRTQSRLATTGERRVITSSPRLSSTRPTSTLCAPPSRRGSSSKGRRSWRRVCRGRTRVCTGGTRVMRYRGSLRLRGVRRPRRVKRKGERTGRGQSSRRAGSK
jgi:hypothetical protein